MVHVAVDETTLPFDWGQDGEVRTWVIPDDRYLPNPFPLGFE